MPGEAAILEDMKRLVPTLFLMGILAAHASGIPGTKLEMIQEAMEAMRLDDNIQSMVDREVDRRTRRIAGDNPELTEEEVREVRRVIADVHAARMHGRGGLMPRVHAVFDRYFTEEDLRFAVRFPGSDGGRRYRELVPRAVHDAMDAGRRWSEDLDLEIRRRLRAVNRNLKL